MRAAATNSANSQGIDAAVRSAKYPVGKYYQFKVRPVFVGGTPPAVEATLLPVARWCGCIRSFRISSDGALHYTSEKRAATDSDPIIDIPAALLRSSP